MKPITHSCKATNHAQQSQRTREIITKRPQNLDTKLKVFNLEKGHQGKRLGFKQGKGVNSHPLSKTLGSSREQQKCGS